ncbi:ABC transporter substrate-binding protein [Dictyobacter arantiisoli]|uniref:Leucine-binding protein domain-containing protein n=1 Tax=Dictyobacter arantiisoli TaxID=2014874 RepID=A0A5A5T896_9CHLR|nr:ABC transporter substrate-binding protein [Dictyobacter arantiisoli]GCF07577.1 hypothetical protein KDI_11410 [Dictyobacter arantiisoli]
MDQQNKDNLADNQKPLPPWLIVTCRRLWKWQALAWGLFLYDILMNSLASLLTIPSAFSIGLRGTLLEILYSNRYLLITVILLDIIVGIIARFPLSETTSQTPKLLFAPIHLISKKLMTVIIIVVTFILLILPLLSALPALTHAFAPTGLGLHEIHSGEYYGICDGSCSFDLQRMDGQLKIEARQAFQSHQSILGCSYLDWAREYDTTDAEANIYYEDQQCKSTFTGRYITYLAVVASSTNASILNYNRDLMQGLYIAQKEYNDSHSVGTHIRILLAAGGDPAGPGADGIQQSLFNQINQLEQTNTINAIVGLPFGFDTLTNLLSGQGIPIISIAPTISSKAIANYLSIVPSLQDEARSAFEYMKNSLHVCKVSVVYSSTDVYSVALEKAFYTAFGGSLVSALDYADNSSYSIDQVVQDLIDNSPDLVYFTGPAEDAGLMMEKLNEHQQKMKFMGGDNIYQFVHAPQASKAEFDNMYFTSYAFPDEWRAQKIAQAPAFINDYKQAFNPDLTHTGNPYTYTRSDSVAILGYDATLLLNKSTEQLPQLTPTTLWQRLLQYTPAQPFKDGLSGQIAFTPGTSTPNNKAVLVLQIQSELTHAIAVEAGYF